MNQLFLSHSKTQSHRIQVGRDFGRLASPASLSKLGQKLNLDWVAQGFVLRSLENRQGPVSSIGNLNEICQGENILKRYLITHLLKKESIILIINNAISYYLFKIPDLALQQRKASRGQKGNTEVQTINPTCLQVWLLKFEFNVMTNCV